MRRTLVDGKSVSCDFDGSFDYSCDVCVVGLGTAGAISAIAAANFTRDVHVIGIDSAPIAGGVAVAGCVWDYYFGANGGVYTELNDICDEIVATDRYINSTVSDKSNPQHKRSYTTPIRGLALAHAFERYNIEAFYSSVVTDVITDGERVCGVACFDGKRSFTVGAKVVIDGAEGAVCRLLGLRDLGGRRSDNKSARFSRTVGTMYKGNLLGKWQFCSDYANTTPAEAAELTFKAAAEAPCLARDYSDPNIRLYSVGWEMGRREVPCIETERVYTFADYLAGNRPDNAIFYSFSPLDNANPDIWNEDEEFQDWQLLCGMHAHGVSVGIPPECLIPRGADGLLLAGKHIGMGHTMTSTVRMRTDIEKCGEAAGVMAAMAATYDCSVRAVAGEHFDTLRQILTASGCYNVENDRGICDLNIRDGEMWKPCKLPETPDELRELLASIHPSLGLIRVRLYRYYGNDCKLPADSLADILAGWLDSDDKLLRENSSVALGLLGDRRALSVLREILHGECEVHVYESPVKFQFPWLWRIELCNYMKAACLVRRYNDPCDEELLASVAAYDGDDVDLIKSAEYAKVKR